MCHCASCATKIEGVVWGEQKFAQRGRAPKRKRPYIPLLIGGTVAQVGKKGMDKPKTACEMGWHTVAPPAQPRRARDLQTGFSRLPPPPRGERPPTVEKAVIPPARLAGATACPAERVARRRAGRRERWPLRPAGGVVLSLFSRGRGAAPPNPLVPLPPAGRGLPVPRRTEGRSAPSFEKAEMVSPNRVAPFRGERPRHEENRSLPPPKHPPPQPPSSTGEGRPLFFYKGGIHRMVGYWGKDRFPPARPEASCPPFPGEGEKAPQPDCAL